MKLAAPGIVNGSVPVATLNYRSKQRVGAVSFPSAMGLLDEAIREHLELKRLRGADPGAVAREEHDALGPASRGEIQPEQEDTLGTSQHPVGNEEHLPLSSVLAPGNVAADAGQETVEINMEAELAADGRSEHDSQTTDTERSGPVAHPAHTRTVSDNSLEWEMPDHGDENADLPGGDQGPGASEDHVESVEDVLEETPDFLRDTPEQERLWFEQRPPRDFDFDE
jgi:hypothetical protein